MTVVRIGVLGAARITPNALIKPARTVAGAIVTAIAARDPERATEFASRHGIPVVHRDYAALLADPGLDAVYIPLPNGLHAQWILAALAEGKHVLCEKPMTSNQAQAEEVAEAAAKSGLVVMEAFHYRYHPLIARVREVLAAGTVGRIWRVRTSCCFPLPRFQDIRYQLDLAGGATMDAGCYAINFLRLLGGAEPDVVDARAVLRSPGVDRAMTAEFRFPDGAAGQITTSLWSRRLLGISATVQGEAGRLSVLNYLAPHLYNRLTIRTAAAVHHERIFGEPTYNCQLRAFVAAIRDGAPVETDAADAVRNMRVIDEVYRAAGLSPRA